MVQQADATMTDDPQLTDRLPTLRALRSASDMTRREMLRRRYEDLGCQPFLGPLPETRWAAAAVSA